MAAKVKLACEHCGDEFEVYECKIKHQIANTGYPPKYCSQKCFGLSKRLVKNSEHIPDSDYLVLRKSVQRQNRIAEYKVKVEGGLCIRCGVKTNEGILCDEHKRITNEKGKKLRLQSKIDVLNAYGGCECVCCGDTHLEFLTLDHINNDGAEHRRNIGGDSGSASFYAKLKKLGFPDCGLRVLCFNCNCARAHSVDGKCPHEREGSNEDAKRVGSDFMLWL